MFSDLDPDRAEIWYRETEFLDERALNEAVRVLSASERERHQRLLTGPSRREYACAHALLRTVLSRYLHRPPEAWEFETSPGGKPLLPGEDRALISFNLSHTDGLVACIVALSRDVGVDAESVKRGSEKEGVAARYFSAEENAELARCGDADRPSRFVDLWTLKEAYLKAIGAGLSERLDDVSFDLRAPGGIRLARPVDVDSHEWQFATFEPTPDHRVAAAVRGQGPHAVRIVAINADRPAAGPLAPARISRPGNGQQLVIA